MDLMLPDAGEVMRRACADACPAPPAPAHPPPPADANAHNRNSPPQNKELLRQQLLAASARDSKEAAGSTPRPKHSRNRQKNRWKLKFHHQALPQEYLDHYEQSLQRAQAARRRPEPASAPAPGPPRKPVHAAAVSPSPLPHDPAGSEYVTWSHRAEDGSDPTARADSDRRKKPAAAPSAPATRAKAVTYDDLPYMGEITLNHAKPRRGRKPKKADICHLIYENYGTVVPGQPQPDGPTRPPSAPAPAAGPPAHAARADLQHRIISSLLERKRRRPPADDEPLNLCIRDLHDLRIRARYKPGEARPNSAAELEQPNAISVIQRNTNLPSPSSGSGSPDASSARTSPALSEPARRSPAGDGDVLAAPGYVYWPSAGVYMHPLALHTQLLYYQRLAAAARAPRADDNGPGPITSTASPDDVGSKLVLKQISELLDPNLLARMEDAEPAGVKRSSPQSVASAEGGVGAGASAGVEARGPAKRKRSAIFIPPVPTRSNAATPTAEVSICKFKFTGGSKPSLQEKKMLSVDAGGNFRYYSGASGKSKPPEGAPRRPAPTPALAEPVAPAPLSGAAAVRGPDEGEARRKRRSRKSLQRERLERTFKEKGFLIQTQQLQSAEGATYCKFRQLRKFTRYLFRSWKDYLPGELHERAPEPPPAPSPRPPDWT